jgi:gluconate 2-dehydrogenase alpha chain
MDRGAALMALNPFEARTATAIFERLFPADEQTPGATEIGVLDYVDHALAGAYRDKIETYRLGLRAVDAVARARHGAPFADCATDQQDQILADLERGELSGFDAPPPAAFFEMLRAHLQEGLFADPVHGGNRDKLGWKVLGHPGIWLEHTPEENLATEPVTKGGIIRSLADLGGEPWTDTAETVDVANFDPQAGARPPREPADVVMVGVGAVGGIIAPILAKAGLRVVALEAGPWRTDRDFLPDELGVAFYARAGMASKFMTEVPRWRRSADEPTQEATFSLGRMVNGVGGSILHYGSWLRRFHPHDFRYRSYVVERWGREALPDGCTLADWPVTYDELEPYYSLIEHLVGVAGDSRYPFIPRSQPYPMPPLRPFRMGEMFREATEALGLHPYPVPVGTNSVPYNGNPATRYTAWSSGIGPYARDRWHPALTTVPEALASGNLELRTHCRAIRIVTDRDGHASGVEYVDANGEVQTQAARTVILCAYTFENVRLMLLSGDERHPDGLGNTAGQVGKHFMTKMFSDISGFFPDTVFNRHTGPAAQSLILDDYVSADFDSLAHGFVGGATLSAENQALPLQISRKPLPPDVPRWGTAYKAHLRQWQHLGDVRIQPSTLPYESNFLDLDPRYRDRSGLGLPVVRITYDLQPNEQHLAEWMETKSEEILRAMGASKTWRGPRFTGVCSSHDLGGCRAGEDPTTSVVNPDLRVHDTPGLYVFSGAVFPSCPGINPTLTIWALCYRAAERLVRRLREGEEP